MGQQLTSPVTADHTLSVLSSEPLTIRLPQNCRQVMTWSSCPFSTCTEKTVNEEGVVQYKEMGSCNNSHRPAASLLGSSYRKSQKGHLGATAGG